MSGTVRQGGDIVSTTLIRIGSPQRHVEDETLFSLFTISQEIEAVTRQVAFAMSILHAYECLSISTHLARVLLHGV